MTDTHKHCVFLFRRDWKLVLLAAALIWHSSLAMEEIVCGGFDMRNSPDHFITTHGKAAIEEWQNCTVIEGDVRYILMFNTEGPPLTRADFDVVKLPKVREITGSLMVFQVIGLESLDILLPNLRVVRGNSLVFNYAFVLFQNPDLKEIGLTKLAEISKGGVRIASNGALCYANTINWTEICRDKVSHIVVENNQDPNNCADKCKNSSAHCSMVNSHTTDPAGPSFHCWSYDTCQTTCPTYCSSKRLACDLDQTPPQCCHKECVGGCVGPTASDCYACRHVNVDGRCERRCPRGLYMTQGRRCITERECRKRKPVTDEYGELSYYKTLHNGICDTRCPIGYNVDPHNPRRCVECANNNQCVKRCSGGVSITNLAEAEGYIGCNVITSHLEINIQSGLTKNVAQELEHYLGDIREVNDYVKVSFSPSLVSLSMLKNLRVIHGKQLLNGKYALSVFENPNLAQLWNFTDSFRIAHGTIQFHNNPRLCYRHIIDMAKTLGLLAKTTEHDVSQFSNGNKAVCDELKISLWLTHMSDEAAVFHWEEFDTEMMDHRMFLGYQLYYRPVESEDVNIFDGRDACHDNWQMIFYESNQRGALVTDLMPYTLYAFYLTTLMVSSPGAKGGMSQVVYHRTKFRHPGQPRIRRMDSSSPSTITLEWDPPLQPNGEVTHYMISYVPKRDVLPKERNYCDEPPTYGSTSDKPLGDMNTNAKALTGRLDFTSTSDTCFEHQCCQCVSSMATNNSRKSAPDQHVVDQQREKAAFENAIHDILLVSSWRKKRSSGSEISFTLPRNSTDHNEQDNRFLAPVVVNVTGLKFTMANLHHFTSYEIRIWACQNITVPENYCSQQELLKTKRTQMIRHKDTVNVSTIHIVNETTSSGNARYIRWEEPDDPNGLIVGYKIEYINVASRPDQTKIECITANDYMRKGGFVITDLTPGNWSIRIGAMSLAQRGEWSKRVYFLIPEPYKFSSTLIIFIAVICSLAVTTVVALLSLTIYRRNFRKKLPEYLMNVFSANPEYISQLEVYKPDEWELKRDDIELLHEIGRGTFGTVYAGMGKRVRSASGVVFGECAVKTVCERASIYDRWHFLIEASVMKQFNVAHIVKLYGVVSEGQPALVVMEMMHKGNLKDYLRSRRPNAEENVDGLSPPTLKESLQWAGEIADGMSYLEALKFCHRDLAARNCMVTANGSCKIGDFGMARDVYVKDYYRPTGRRLMPVRWMSPEALKDATFTSKSDTWSYGVVLWEIATLASQPYAGLSNEDVIRFVVDERRKMEMPTGCPPKLYQLMALCWKYDPKERPTFAELLNSLLPDMSDHFLQVSYFCTQRGKDVRVHNLLTINDGRHSPSRSSLSKKNSEPIDSHSGPQTPICQNNRRPGSGNSMNSPVSKARKMSNSEPVCLASSCSTSPQHNEVTRGDGTELQKSPNADRRPSNEKLLGEQVQQ